MNSPIRPNSNGPSRIISFNVKESNSSNGSSGSSSSLSNGRAPNWRF